MKKPSNETIMTIFIAILLFYSGYVFFKHLKVPVLNVVLFVAYFYMATLYLLSLFREKKGIKKAVEWMLKPLKAIADLFKNETAQKWFTVSVVVAFYLVGVFFALSLMIVLRDVWQGFVLCAGYILIVFMSLTITLPSFAKLFERIRVEPMGPYDISMGKQLVNVCYFITIIYNSVYTFFHNGNSNAFISSFFVAAFLTYIAIDRIRVQHAEMAKKNKGE